MTDLARLPGARGVVLDLDGTVYEAGRLIVSLPLADLVVVGDDIDSDVRGAMAAGARGVLVRTGKFRDSDLAGPDRAPDAVIGSIAELATLLGLAA